MKTVLLSFDIEEFDMPFEYKGVIPFEDQIKISTEGSHIILDMLKEKQAQATFFSTVVFAQHSLPVIERIRTEDHELASHGYYHSKFEEPHLRESKEALEKLAGVPIEGFRMARMMKVPSAAIEAAGYDYDSSLNPVYLPGRYNNFNAIRTIHKANNLTIVPASATPLLRIPLFWISFHNFPLWLYKFFAGRCITSDGYLNLYFHPWEFIDLKKTGYNFPFYLTKNTGKRMTGRFSNLLDWMKENGYRFRSIGNYLQEKREIR